MANIKQWLEEAVTRYGEPIEAMVVGQHDNARYGVPIAADENVLLPVGNALKKVDVEYYNGFGGADCFPFYAWTKSRIFFIGEYDGATQLAWVPRNPIDIAPRMSGENF